MTDGRQTKTRVAAIDPGSVKAGMVVLDIQSGPPGFAVPDSGAVAVLARRTARPRGDFAWRMSDLFEMIEEWTDDAMQAWDPGLCCIEDPRDFPLKLLRGRGAAVSLGAAFGVACVAFGARATRYGIKVTLVPAMEWYPKTRSGNRTHPMKHAAAREWLRGRWPALRDCTDDETFASGVALWAYTRGAMAATYPI